MKRGPIINVLGMLAMWMCLGNSALGHPAWGIAVDRNNQIYFSDLETVWKVDATGKLTVFRAAVGGRHVHDITLDETGNLHGVDNSYEPSTQRFISALWRMTPSGEFSFVLDPTHVPPKGMTIWKDRAGNRYYVGQPDNNSPGEFFVLKRTPAGAVTTLAGNRKAGDAHRQSVLYSVGGMAFGMNDTLYFIANSKVHKVPADGRLTMVAGDLTIKDAAANTTPDSRRAQLFGLAVDNRDAIFVADYGNRRVVKIDPAGAISTVARAETPWSPTGVVWKDDSLYVLESGSTPPGTHATRVRKVAADGKITVIASVGGNFGPALAENTPAENSGAAGVSSYRIPYFYLSVGLGVVGIASVMWWLRKRTSTFHD